ncbi:MAG: redoxin domain-containing protein [Planctomycetota bacterium]
MKTATGLIVLIVVVAAMALAVAAPAPAQGETEEEAKAKLGQKVPEFKLVDTNGQERSLADYEGRIVVLEWINPRCPYVQNLYKMKAMQNAYKQVKAMDKGVAWVAINSTYNTTAEQNNYWIKNYDLKYPILLDVEGEVGRVYDARRTPHMFVIDKEGVLRYHGAIDDNQFGNKPAEKVTNYAVNAVRQIVGGETVAPDFVKPYGCTVKIAR